MLLTFTRGPVCAVTGYMECPTLISDSCRNTVQSVAPGQTSPAVLFTVPGSQTIGEVVPSPDGTRAVLSMAPCTANVGTTGLFIRDLASGRATPVTTSNNPCDGFGRAAWNSAGTKLVFVFARAYGPPSAGITSFCPGARNRLAIASLKGSSASRSRTLLAPDRGCVFGSASFDRDGIAATEGCKRGSPHDAPATSTGYAFLLQFNRHNRVARRVALKRGLEESLVATEPSTGDALVTQDQPANNGSPEDDWVWTFDGTRLDTISHYRAFDAAQVIAVPW